MHPACLPCRLPVLVLALALVATACGVIENRTPLTPLEDLRTTTPRSLVESGRGQPATPPDGVRYGMDLAFVEATKPSAPSKHYEMILWVRRNEACSIPWQADVHGVELVDDEGRALRPARISRLKQRHTTAKDGMTTTHKLEFHVPMAYRLRRIGYLTAHWTIVAEGQTPTPISSRFRR